MVLSIIYSAINIWFSQLEQQQQQTQKATGCGESKTKWDEAEKSEQV